MIVPEYFTYENLAEILEKNEYILEFRKMMKKVYDDFMINLIPMLKKAIAEDTEGTPSCMLVPIRKILFKSEYGTEIKLETPIYARYRNKYESDFYINNDLKGIVDLESNTESKTAILLLEPRNSEADMEEYFIAHYVYENGFKDYVYRTLEKDENGVLTTTWRLPRLLNYPYERLLGKDPINEYEFLNYLEKDLNSAISEKRQKIDNVFSTLSPYLIENSLFGGEI